MNPLAFLLRLMCPHGRYEAVQIGQSTRRRFFVFECLRCGRIFWPGEPA